MMTQKDFLREDAPQAEEIRAALDRIITSDVLRACPRLIAFLRFVVEGTLNGNADRIKGYTIAVEALGRDKSFDPQANPLVRVEAGRLRRALGEYYERHGHDDPIEIGLPRGSYIPTFTQRHVVVSERPTFFADPRGFLKVHRELVRMIGFGAIIVTVSTLISLALDFAESPCRRPIQQNSVAIPQHYVR